MLGRMRGAALALAGVVAMVVAPACTVVKPVVCTFTYPIGVIAADLSSDDDAEGEEHEQIPPPLLCVAAPVVIPIRFVGLALCGFAGGIVSGFASDLNVVLWNFDDPMKNLTRPFLTNMKEPEIP